MTRLRPESVSVVRTTELPWGTSDSYYPIFIVWTVVTSLRVEAPGLYEPSTTLVYLFEVQDVHSLCYGTG